MLSAISLQFVSPADIGRIKSVQAPTNRDRAGMYTMRLLEGTTNGAPERSAGTDSDSAVSSMGSERVPSLSSDTEWMETNSDSGHTPADHYSADYHGSVHLFTIEGNTVTGQRL